jgi:hypothetical protein
MGVLEANTTLIYGVHIRESANDGSDFTNAATDYRVMFVGEDGLFHLKDSAGTVTTPAFGNPMTTQGDIIYGGASGLPTRLAAGTSTHVLTSNGAGAAPSWQASGGGGGSLTLLEQHTASSSATLDFTTFISSTYDDYMFEIVNLIPATDSVRCWLQVGTGGGPTYDSGNNLVWCGFRNYSGGSATAGAANPQIPLDSGQDIDNSANYGLWGSVRLFKPQSTAPMPKFTGEIGYVDTSATVFAATVSGIYVGGAAITGVRFLMSSGNIASGTVRVYGHAK